MDGGERKIAEFNEMSYQIQRLQNHWMDIARLRQRGEFAQSRWRLDSIEAELWFDMQRLDENEGTKYLEELEEINKSITSAKTGMKFYELILKKEKFLRKIQQEAGKGAKYKLADEDLLE